MNSKLLIVVSALIIAGGLFFMLRPSEKLPSSSELPTTPTTQPSEEPVVEVTENAFSPSALTIKKGTKVTWVNKSGVIANISSGPHPVHNIYPPLNLENFNNEESLSLTFDKPGTYGYHDHLNPNRTGIITVE